MYLQKILCDMGYPMTTRDDYEHVRVIKETLCFCSLNPAEDQNREDLEKTYHLPDGLTLRDGVTT
ncbi:actin like protein alp1 [Cystoisospora suis]|nr:actin like protein alp1 [Cystoisospora suis]